MSNGLRPDPLITINECADKYRVLPKSYKEKGRYRTSRTPFAREIMECLSPSSPIRQIKFMKPTQICGTEIINNWVIFNIRFNPGPMLFVLPTVDLAKKHSKKKLSTTIQETPIVANLVKKARSRDSGNTILVKEYPGGSISLTGANSEAATRSDSIRDLALDDIDGYPLDIEKKGDPCDLFTNRTDAYPNRKILKISTPTAKETSRIAIEYEDSDQREYFVPCPHCNKKQTLEWGGKTADFGIKFNHKGPVVQKVWYECKFCHKPIEEYNKTWMLENGEWIAQNPGHPDAGFHLNSLYSPIGFLSWADIVAEFLKIKKNVNRLKRWVNTRLGLPFEEDGTQPEWEILQARAEHYKIMTVPRRGLFITGGVDVQDNRIAVKLKAWGRGEESFLIFWAEIYGDPGQDTNPGMTQGEVWKELDKIIYQPYKHEGGADIPVVFVGVDSGGHHTQSVYNYCRTRAHKVFALKGSSRPGRPILGKSTAQDVNYKGKIIKNGVQLWSIGTDTAKSQIYTRLKLTEPGPGYSHFPIGLPESYYTGLTSEKMFTRYNANGYPVNQWVNVAKDKRNEPLDCEVYATAAAYRAGINRYSQKMWDDLELSIVDQRNDKKEGPKERSTPAKSNWMSQ